MYEEYMCTFSYILPPLSKRVWTIRHWSDCYPDMLVAGLGLLVLGFFHCMEGLCRTPAHDYNINITHSSSFNRVISLNTECKSGKFVWTCRICSWMLEEDYTSIKNMCTVFKSGKFVWTCHICSCVLKEGYTSIKNMCSCTCTACI